MFGEIYIQIYIYIFKKSQVKDSLIPNKETVNIRRKGVIIGKNSSDAFVKTNPRRYNVYLSMLNNDVTADDITYHIYIYMIYIYDIPIGISYMYRMLCYI